MSPLFYESLLFEKSRKRFSDDPTVLAEQLLLLACAHVVNRGLVQVNTDDTDQSEISVTDPWPLFGMEWKEKTNRQFRHWSTGMIYDIHGTWEDMLDVNLRDETLGGVAGETSVMLTSWTRAPSAKGLRLERKNFDRIFNTLAERLWRRRLKEKTAAINVYGARAENLERTSNEAERDRRLEEAFKNREAMAALMADQWIGLHLLDVLNSLGKGTVSELAARVSTDVDSAAVILARMLRSDLVEISDSHFLCTRRGVQILENLEEALDTSSKSLPQLRA